MNRRYAAILLALLVGGCAPSWQLGLGLSQLKDQVIVRGLEQRDLERWAELDPARREAALRVWVAEAAADSPSVLGAVKQRGGELVFEPRYPFEAGLKYRAQFDPAVLGQSRLPIELQFEIPKELKEPVAKVVAIYPSGDELPENLLKFYIHFSEPMSRGEAYQRLMLLDEKGKPLPSPFLELSEELWNPQMTRFTLFFEPGRIKEGLVPRQEMGPTLLAGHTYTLVVDSAWRDGENRPLVEPARKTFRVAAADHAQPDPSRWEINSPAAGSKQALALHFDEPLDHAMLGRVLSVRDGSGRELAGTTAIDEQEQRWTFVPKLPWQRGKHSVVVENVLEDTAGNSIGRPFEVDLNRGSAAEGPQVVEIQFEVTFRN